MSVKIKSISVTNFKAIDAFTADFNGCTAIVTAGNNKGKTSLLRGIADRIRFIRPDIKVKTGEAEGSGEMVLTDGSRFKWSFDEKGKDTLVFFSDKDIKSNVTKELGARFFPPVFDIDKFLQSTPKEQSKQLQAIAGIDFTDIDKRYAQSFNDRAAMKSYYETLLGRFNGMGVVEECPKVDITELQSQKYAAKKRFNDLFEANQAANRKLRAEWDKSVGDIKKAYSEECRRISDEILDFNETQRMLKSEIDRLNNAYQAILEIGYRNPDLDAWVREFACKLKPIKVAQDLFPPEPVLPAEPEYVREIPDDGEIAKIDAAILDASNANGRHSEWLAYSALKKQVAEAKKSAMDAHEKVLLIDAERKAMIASANFPKGVDLAENGITVDDLPLERNQISTSKLYCAALRIAAMKIGEVRSLYFDASFLDRATLSEIQAWAVENDLQLLIERPDFEGGEIKYEIIEH